MQPYTHEVVTLWYRAPELLLEAPLYGPAVDLWACGCVIAEIATSQPLFTGGTEVEMLMKIFCALGTPTEETWPGVSRLPHFNPSFPRFHRKLEWDRLRASGMEQHTRSTVASSAIRAESSATADADTVLLRDLLHGLCRLDPSARLTADDALRHPYFDSLREPECLID